MARGWLPFEHDDYYSAVFAAVGVGYAPDGYAETEKAREGLNKLRTYFKKNPPPNFHHKAWLLWASLKIDGLMSTKLCDSTIAELRALQHADGGWSLVSLRDWVGVEERPYMQDQRGACRTDQRHLAMAAQHLAS
jgi:squalene-hopene/tetraprenyl-beta-curcumene cyclase